MIKASAFCSYEVVTAESLSWLRARPAESFDSVVTSPPYGNQRSYGGADPDAYADWITPWLQECLRLLRPTGSMMLNLGRIMREGEEHPYAIETLFRAREVGLKWVDTVIWHKPNAIPLSHPSYLHGMHEFVWWLAPRVDCYRGYDADTRRPHAEGTLRRIGQPYMTRKGEKGGYGKRSKGKPLHPDGAKPSSVFSAGVGATRGLKHTAPMALATALQLVSLSTPPLGLVLDPFCGSCTTGVACKMRGRSFVGVEHEPEAAQEGRDRLDSVTV